MRVGEGTCEEEGVWGAVTGLVGTGMASEAIKLIIGMEGELDALNIRRFRFPSTD